MSAAVYGTGIGLGLNDGESNLTLYTTSDALSRSKTGYGQPIGSASAAQTLRGGRYVIGVTTNSSKSGLACNIGNLKITSKKTGTFIIKY